MTEEILSSRQKLCSKCGVSLPEEAFHRHGPRRSSWCRECRAEFDAHRWPTVRAKRLPQMHVYFTNVYYPSHRDQVIVRVQENRKLKAQLAAAQEEIARLKSILIDQTQLEGKGE